MSKFTKLTRYLLYIAIFLIPFYFFRFEIAGIPTNLLEVSILIIFIIHIVDYVVSKKEIKLDAIDWSVLIFLFFALLAVTFSPDKIAALGIFKGWFLAPALFYFVARGSFIKNEAFKLAIPLFGSSMIVTTWSILQKFGVISTLFYQQEDANFNQYLSGNVRLFGPFESPNYLAMFIVPSAFLALALIPKIKYLWLKAVIVILEFASLYVLYFSKSRGGLLALGAGLLMLAIGYLINRYKVHRSVNLKASVAFFLILFAFFVYRYGFNPERDNTRLEIYKYSWQMLKDNYITGIGFGSFEDKISSLSLGNPSFQENILTYALHPHNLYLAIYLNLVIGGFLIFLLLIYQFFAVGFRSLDKNLAVYPLAAMTAILAHGLVDTTYFKNDLSALFFLALAFLAITNINAKAHNK